jgi:tetratricopeptide (TPR) repeat protein/tRNA A-37 threonylcarbamoyl transferase component Bud32
MSGKKSGGDDSKRDLPFAQTVAGDGDDWSAEHGPVLSEAEVVAGRYRVVRYVARGGMGEVYEAEDLELGERVALKTIRERAKDHVAEERFKREIQLSRKVTHPNVCRIFDFGIHERKGGERLVFLTMELLSGETLLQRIKREGPMAPNEAAQIVRQIVAGLSAAHAVRVVHRDLKSANVILVPRHGGGMRAVITDFGLAHVASEEQRGQSLSGGAIVGTPGYMAPEQVEGGELSDRTDVYALGVVMFEMVTGDLPFDGATPLSVATKRLTSPAPSPKKRRPELPAKWERAVLACLERAPEDRPQSARMVLGLLGAVTDSLEDIDGTVRIPRTPKRLPLVRPALVLSAVVVALIVAQRWRRPVPKSTQLTLAALPFTPVGDAAKATAGLGSVAAETMGFYLGGPSLHVQGASSVASAVQDVGVAADVEPTPSQVEQLRAALSVDYFIRGRFTVGNDGREITLDADLMDAHTKAKLASAHERGTVDELTNPLHSIGQRLASRLGVKPEELGAGVGFTLPRKAASLRSFIEARELMAHDDDKAAVLAAQRGVAEEPDYARFHWMLARAHQRSGYERAAVEEAKQAVKLAAGLPRHERLFIEGISHSVAGDHATAITELEALHAEIPNDEETSLLLSEEYASAGRPQEALNAAARLRQTTLSPAGRQRLDLVEAQVAESAGDFDAALRASQRAIAGADAVDSKSARARARYAECRLLDILKRTAEARAACEETRRIANELGLRRLRAEAIYIIAWLDFAHGDLDDAQRAYEGLLEVYRDTGDATGESGVLNSLANIANARGNRDEARKLFQDAVRMSDAMEDARAGATPRQNLCEMAMEEGELNKALALAESAEKAFAGSGEPTEIVSSLCRVIGVYVAMGKGRDVARKIAELEAVEAQLVNAAPSDLGCDLLNFDLAMGKNQISKAVDIGRSMVSHASAANDDSELVSARVMLGTALVLSGDRVKAAEQVALALPLANKFRGWQSALELRLLQLRIDVAAGATDLAPRVKAAEGEIRVDEAVARRLQYRTDLADIAAHVTGLPQAVKALRALAAESSKLGLVSQALQAELYAIEHGAESGHRATPREIKDPARLGRAR